MLGDPFEFPAVSPPLFQSIHFWKQGIQSPLPQAWNLHPEVLRIQWHGRAMSLLCSLKTPQNITNKTKSKLRKAICPEKILFYTKWPKSKQIYCVSTFWKGKTVSITALRFGLRHSGSLLDQVVCLKSEAKPSILAEKYIGEILLNGHVWKCGCGCFSKYFSLRNISK